LRTRKLLDEVGLQNLRREMRDWAGMGNDELVVHAKEFIAEKGISGRGELKKADEGLYQALRKRKLLDAVFTRLERSAHLKSVDEVLDAVDSFSSSNR
jgi:hypothetical protein